jgi:hypothetical protein
MHTGFIVDVSAFVFGASAVSAVWGVDTIFTSHHSWKLRTNTSSFHQKVVSPGFTFSDYRTKSFARPQFE